MESNEILVERRAAHGKGSARKLRFAGRIPGLFYGPGRPAIPLTLDPNTVHAVVGRTGKDRLLRLKTAGADELDGQMVILKDAQRDPIKRRIIHADFFEIRMDREIEAMTYESGALFPAPSVHEPDAQRYVPDAADPAAP